MYKRTVLSLAVAGAVSMTSYVFAQDGANNSEPIVDVALEEVVVTGSRIQRDGYSAPTPITVAATADMMKITPSNIPDGLNKLPQFQLSSSPAQTSHNFADTANHGNVLNLRGVGGERTLILMDGMRVPPTNFRGTVDVNVLPQLLVDRVEIVTGGASAVYGSDAVAGVVNFVLDKNFTGVKGIVQGGMSAEGDNENSRVGIAAGFDFNGGNSHALFSIEQYDNDGMLRSDRKEAVAGWIYAGANPDCLGVPGAACAPGSAGNPYTLVPDGRLVVATDLGLISSGAFAGQRFVNPNVLVPFDPGTRTGSAIFASGGDGYTIPFDVTSVAPLKTQQVFGRINHDINPDIAAYVQGTYSRSEIEYSSLANSFTGVTPATIFSGNPFLPDEVQASMGPDDSIVVGHYNGGGPKPQTDEQGDFWMVALGLEGAFGDDFRWKLQYSGSENTYEADQSGLYNWQRAYAALDAVVGPNGDIVCGPSLSPNADIAARFADCKPINILGIDPSIGSPEGYAYATGTSSWEAKTSQHIFAGSLSGVAFEMPAGPVDFVAGAEYRQEDLSLTSNADPALLDTAEERDAHFAGVRGVPGSALFFWLNNVGVADGDRDVTELFVETNIPLLAGVTGVQSLDLNAAWRYTDYSTSGSADTWKLGLQWRPAEDLLIRATQSTDIRAPSLHNLFAGRSSSISTFFDPVSGQQNNIQAVLGGNPDLQPEESDTFTAGFVLAPRAIPGLSLSVDYYSLEVEDAIGSLNGQQIIDNCFSSGGAGPECSLISRPSPNEFPSSVLITQANIASLETSGIDIDLTYSTDSVGPGTLTARLYLNHLLKYETQQFAGAPIVKFEGITEADTIPDGRPDWSGLLTLSYQIGDFGAHLAQRYIDAMEVGLPGTNSVFVDGDVDAVWYTDLTLSYNFRMEDAELELFGTVNNMFDKDFPIIPSTVPGANMPTTISVYDTIGRAFTAGIRFNF